MPPTYADAWVCTDCYYAHHYGYTEIGGEFFVDGAQGASDRRPLGLLAGADLADNTCSNHDGTDDETCSECDRVGTDSGYQEFSRCSCDGCGSTLGGARHRLAVFGT